MRCLLLICALIAAPGIHAAASDFNGDGRSDILWRNAVTGENYIYPMDNTGTGVMGAEGFTRTVPDQNWQIAGVGDFDGDGKADILWRNRATGENYIFPMDTLLINGTENYIFTVGSQNWQVAAVADFDGDGKADILWRNRVTGENYIHLMNGLAVASEGYIRTVPIEWVVAGVGDFDGPGPATAKMHILWRNSRTGENYVYPMNGLIIDEGTEGYLRTVPDQVWQVAGIGNFDGASGDDILWRNRVSGENYIFFMTGATTIDASEGYIRTVTDQKWQVAQVGDFNGDGEADILWRHGYSAEQYIYLMNGKSVIAGEGYTRTVVNAWRPAGPLGFQVGATPGCEAISAVGVVPSVSPARTSGVAPLYVFFDATATTSNQTSRPFHEAEFRWNFGDTGSGAWRNGSRPGVSLRNEATGGVAAHVFEQPGTYNVCVSVFDGINTSSASIAITVTDPETVFASTTRCVSTDGNFDGCPTSNGAHRVTSNNFTTALETGISGSGRRILFKRGQTFNVPAVADVVQNGPGLIGAFGSGPDPILEYTNPTPLSDVVRFSASSFNNSNPFADWRIMNLEVDGNMTNPANGSAAVIGTAGVADQILILGLNIHNTNGSAIYFNHATVDTANKHLYDQVATVDTTVSISEESGGYISAGRGAFMGNRFEFSQSHGVRFPMTFRGVVNNNTIQDPGSAHSVVKMVGPDFITGFGGGKYTEFVQISDNHLISNDNGWMYELQSQDAAENERLRELVVERNLLQGGPGSSALMMISATQVTLRNNIANFAHSSSAMFINRYSSAQPLPRDIWVYNNTYYKGESGSFRALDIGNLLDQTAGGPNVVIRNNLAYAPPPASSSATLLEDLAGNPVIPLPSDNSTNTEVRTVSPNFVMMPPTVPMHYRPNDGSYAINSGALVPVWSDFFRIPQPGTRSMGAILPH